MTTVRLSSEGAEVINGSIHARRIPVQLLKRLFLPTVLVFANCLGFAAPASAQLFGPGSSSVSSFAYVGAGNLSNDGSGNVAVWPTLAQFSPTGLPVIASGTLTFTGTDGNGTPNAMMSLIGTGKAAADYGVLHAYASGEVDTPYYNATNPTYYAGSSNGGKLNIAGSPQYLQVLGQAAFMDTLTLKPTIDPIVGIRYQFHVDGNVDDDQHAYADLGNTPGMPTTDWATPTWNVTPGAPIPIAAYFQAVFHVNAAVENGTVQATADFYNTLTVTSIQLLDANGNQVNGATYLTASGTHYNVLGGTYGPAATPEPGSVALLVGLGVSGATCLLKRRRTRS
jgi:hypothetical protein